VPEETAQPTRHTRREAGSGMAALLAVEHEADSEEEEVAVAAVPKRSTRAAPAAAAQAGTGLLQLAMVAAADETELQALAAQLQAAEAEVQAAEVEAAEAAAAGGSGEGSSGEGSSSAFELPAHLAEARTAVLAHQTKNWDKIATAHLGAPRAFQLGEVVLFRPPKCGRNGGVVGPKSITCRVVGVPAARKYGAGTNYRLRCNSGVIKGSHNVKYLFAAPPKSASMLAFEGHATLGVNLVSLAAAVAAEMHGGIARCGCRGPCGAGCKCKLANVKCGRHCGCKHGKGANCGNC
jgi:hypothetical protein